jgi:UDP-N-acetyl-D-glucosamine dehydrogenase
MKDGKTRKGELFLSRELIEKSDLVMITTAHSSVDYEFVQKHANMIFDTKNAMKYVKDRDNIELL